MIRIIIILATLILLSACGEEYNPKQHYETITDDGPADTSYSINGNEVSKDNFETYKQGIENDRISTQSIGIYTMMGWSLYIGYYLAGIVLGIFVYRDAKKQDNLAMGITPIWWAVMTALEAPLGVLAYWIIHHSSLIRKQ